MSNSKLHNDTKIEDKRAKPEVGLKVRVLSPDLEEDWGVGEIIELTELYLETEDGEKIPLVDDYPIIKLQDGRIIGGIECWWYPLEWEQELTEYHELKNKSQR